MEENKPIAEYFVGVSGSDIANELICQYVDSNKDGTEISFEGNKIKVYSVTRLKMNEISNNFKLKGMITFYCRYEGGVIKEHTFNGKNFLGLVV